MIWALLALLGIPIWFIVGFLVGILVSRRKFKQHPDVFVIAVRAENADKWPRQPSYGRLVRDVLVLNRGAALLRTEVHAVDSVSPLDIGDGPKHPVDALGRLLTFDDGTRREVAVAGSEASRLDTVEP